MPTQKRVFLLAHKPQTSVSQDMKKTPVRAEKRERPKPSPHRYLKMKESALQRDNHRHCNSFGITPSVFKSASRLLKYRPLKVFRHSESIQRGGGVAGEGYGNGSFVLYAGRGVVRATEATAAAEPQ